MYYFLNDPGEMRICHRPKHMIRENLRCLLEVISLGIQTGFLCWLLPCVHTTLSILSWCVISCLFWCVVLLKRILILIIKNYQRYASESIRQRCRLMPSCSDYAIIALTRCNIVKGIFMICVRLKFRCLGWYIIDFPH